MGLPPLAVSGNGELDEPYQRIFGHTLRGAVCVYETEYGTGHAFRQGQELADLGGWYAAFGLGRKAKVHERADHIAIEIEFLGFLAQREAYLLLAARNEEADQARDASRTFLRDHVGRFGIAVGRQLERVDDGGFYGRVGGLLCGFLLAECWRLDVPPGPTKLPLRQDEGDDVPMGCGTGSEDEDDCGACAPMYPSLWQTSDDAAGRGDGS